MYGVRLGSERSGAAAIPREIGIATDDSADPPRSHPIPLPAPEMTPDRQIDLQVGERFARAGMITIRSDRYDVLPVRPDAAPND
jgi:hypothetical protein